MSYDSQNQIIFFVDASVSLLLDELILRYRLSNVSYINQHRY